MTTQKESIVDLLRKKGKQSLDYMETQLKLPRHIITTNISQINNTHKNMWCAIQIHRTGKNGESSYELQEGNTEFNTIKKTMNRHGKSMIKHGKNYQEISTIAMVNTLDINERKKIAQEMISNRNQLREEIAIELHN